MLLGRAPRAHKGCVHQVDTQDQTEMFFFSPNVKVNTLYIFSLEKKVPSLFDIYLTVCDVQGPTK